jgi:hypothetical protein
LQLFALQCNSCAPLAWGLAMMQEAKSWFVRVGRPSRSNLVTQAAVLAPVLAIAGMMGWAMLWAPTRAGNQPDETTVTAMFVDPQEPSRADSASAPTEAVSNAPQEGASPALAGPPAVNGLKIFSQSWRRGGLGSRALVTFTLRNDNDYAVKDIEIACAFSRRDGSHLTDRKRVIPDAVVNMKSRKTFAHLLVGYVNINANKAKCAPIAANRT